MSIYKLGTRFESPECPAREYYITKKTPLQVPVKLGFCCVNGIGSLARRSERAHRSEKGWWPLRPTSTGLPVAKGGGNGCDPGYVGPWWVALRAVRKEWREAGWPESNRPRVGGAGFVQPGDRLLVNFEGSEG